MMNNINIKKKLLLYSIIIQVFILLVFSFSIYKTLHISTLDKIETSLKIILLDIVDDIVKYKNKLDSITFDEEKEYKFQPLYIRLLDKNTQIIHSSFFPKSISLPHKDMPLESIEFEIYEEFIISQMQFKKENETFYIQIGTDYKILNETMENLFYILIFIAPLILIFSTIGGYFIIYKSFAPIEKVLSDLKKITSSTLSQRLFDSKNNDEINMLAKEINSLLERLESSFEKINQFSSDASHELKTPLTIIRGEIEVALRKDRTAKEYKEILQSSLNEVLIIQQTIDDLLFLAKNEHSAALITEDVYLDEISLESIEDLKPLSSEKSITITPVLTDLVQIKGSNKLIKIAVKNILKNAIQYSFNNSSIDIINYLSDDYAAIVVQDYGIGIAKEDQEKIFEKFYRTDKSRNKYSGGTGLGMSLVEKIIKLHKGEIKIQSSPNKGTTITLLFHL